MKKNILLIFFIVTNSIVHSQVLDGIYYTDRDSRPVTPKIYQTRFINTKWNDTLGLMMNEAVKPDLKKLPAFSDCILVNGKASSFFNSPAVYAYYTDSGKYTTDTLMNLSIETDLDLSLLWSPFYFRKFEVTNKEYREFTNWVRDSIARTMLAEFGIEGYREEESEWPEDDYRKLLWKKRIEWDSEDPEYREALADMYLPEQERFYRRKELDVRRFIYDFSYSVDGFPYHEKVCIYPDTLVWLKNMDGNEMESMSKLYFWNEQYDNYPVVGISWNQARAYLHWKERQINQSLQKKYPGIEVHLSLPSVVEWQLANRQVKDGANDFYNPWLCNLIIGSENRYKESVVVKVDSQSVKIEPVVYTYSNHGVIHPYEYRDGIYVKEHVPQAKYLRIVEKDTTLFINASEYHITVKKWFFDLDNKGSFYNPLPLLKPDTQNVINQYYLVSPANLFTLKNKEKINTFYKKEQTVITTRLKVKYLYSDVSFTEGNVSEWMLNDYQNWQPGFQAHMLQIENKESIDADLEYNQEFLGDYWNAKNGKLIKGSNWYHDACTQGETIDANVQRFADPDSSYSTVGFRYVIHIKTLPQN